MIREILKLYTDNGDDSIIPFHDIDIDEYSFSVSRMGMPSLTSTLKFPLCLDKEWNQKQNCEFRGEKYYIRQTPTSTKDSKDMRYSHELKFTSERDELFSGVYFIDAVYDESSTISKPCTNSPKFKFYGNLYEIADRINCVLRYAKIGDSLLNTKTRLTVEDIPVGDGYCCMVDPNGSGEPDKMYEIEFEDKTLWEGISEIFNKIKIPFEFRHKALLWNAEPKVVSHVFKYGYDNALLSITKTNANAKVINRITMRGSSENIPYYYPNETEYGHIGLRFGTPEKQNSYLTGERIAIENPIKLIRHVRADDIIECVSNGSGFGWKVGNTVYSDLSKIGLKALVTLNYFKALGETIMWDTEYRLPLQENLMPPKYRNTKGQDIFYPALNNTYPLPENTDDYFLFPHPYVEGAPCEHIYEDEEIKPTIEGIRNAVIDDETGLGQLFGEIAEVAFDDNDNDDLKSDEDSGDALKYKHSFFYIKLHLFNGNFGFNLFDHASQDDAMTIQITSGACAGCKFKIQAEERVDEGGFNYYLNPVQVNSNGNIVAGDYNQKVITGNVQERQQNTMSNEIWICLQKDVETFGHIMPSKENNYIPKAGDTFNIINIDLPEVYIRNAEKRLEDAGLQYMAENNEDKFNFSVSASRIFFAENPDILAELDEYSKIKVEYNDSLYELFIKTFKMTCKSNEALPDVQFDLTDTISVGESFAQKVANQAISMLPDYTRNRLTFDTAERRYLSKQRDDRTPYNLSVGDKFTSERTAQFGKDFDPDIVTGFGGQIDEYGNGWFESLTVRRFLEVPELKYNRVSVNVGNSWRAPGGGVIESVVKRGSTQGRIELKLEEGEWGSFEVGDICMGIFHSENPLENEDEQRDDYDDISFTGFCTVYFRVLAVSGDYNQYLTYQLRPNTTIHPKPCMSIVAYGNFDKKHRQTSQYSTRTYERYLRNVNDWTFGAENVAAQFGDLSGLVVNGKSMQGYSAYLDNIYMTGVIENLNIDIGINTIITNTQYVVLKKDGTYSPDILTATAKRITANGMEQDITDAVLSYYYTPKGNGEIIGQPQQPVGAVFPAGGLSDFSDITFPIEIRLLKGNEDVAPPVTISLVEDGVDGERGSSGIEGATMRITEWDASKQYEAGTTLDSNGIRWLDIVTLTSADGASTTVWKCISRNIGQKPQALSTYWQQFSTFTPIYTPLLLADNAIFRFAQSQEIVIVKGNQVYGRLGTGDYPFWLGGATADSSNFKIDANGFASMSGARLLSSGDGRRIEIDPVGNTLKAFDDDKLVSQFGGEAINPETLFSKGTTNAAGARFTSSTATENESTEVLLGTFNNSAEINISSFQINVATPDALPNGDPNYLAPRSAITVNIYITCSNGGKFEQVLLGSATVDTLGKEDSLPQSKTINVPAKKMFMGPGTIKVIAERKVIRQGNWSGAYSNKHAQNTITNYSISANEKFYMSRYAANGFIIGDGSSNYVAAYMQNERMKFHAETELYGVDISNDGIKFKIGGVWKNFTL